MVRRPRPLMWPSIPARVIDDWSNILMFRRKNTNYLFIKMSLALWRTRSPIFSLSFKKKTIIMINNKNSPWIVNTDSEENAINHEVYLYFWKNVHVICSVESTNKRSKAVCDRVNADVQWSKWYRICRAGDEEDFHTIRETHTRNHHHNVWSRAVHHTTQCYMFIYGIDLPRVCMWEDWKLCVLNIGLSVHWLSTLSIWFLVNGTVHRIVRLPFYMMLCIAPLEYTHISFAENPSMCTPYTCSSFFYRLHTIGSLLLQTPLAEQRCVRAMRNLKYHLCYGCWVRVCVFLCFFFSVFFVCFFHLLLQSIRYTHIKSSSSSGSSIEIGINCMCVCVCGEDGTEEKVYFAWCAE